MNLTANLLAPEIAELIRARNFADLRRALEGVPQADMADLLEELEPADAVVAFRVLPRSEAGEVFAHLEPDHQEELIHELGASAPAVFESMDPDDRVRLLDELPAPVATRLVNALSAEERRATQAIMGYPPGSVGRLMNPDYIRLRADWTVEHALTQIRRYGRDAESINVVYVVNDKGVLIDDIRLRQIILAQPEQTIEALMDDRFVALHATDDQEEAVRAMLRYDRIALPVVDSEGVLLGAVSADDAADIAEEEVTEDFQKLAGMEALDEPYARVGFFEMLRKRSGVLCVLMVFQSLTIPIMGFFESRITVAALLLFIPLIISSGGNTGTQAASLLIRSLALGELTPGDWFRVIRKELTTGLAMGAMLGLLAGVSVFLWDLTPQVDLEIAPLHIGLAVGVAVLAIVVWAVTLGSMFPLILEKLRLDPATISSPLVATLMDLSGLVIYFAVAVPMLLLLGG